MEAIVALEARFDRTPDGRVWSDGSFDYGFWQRYLDVFDEVHVVARVRDVERQPEYALVANGPNVLFRAVPYFVGPWQFVAQHRQVRRVLRAAMETRGAVILRVPGTIGTYLAKQLQQDGRPYGVEVVGDPYDVFAPRAGVRSILRRVMRWWYPVHLRRQCAGACAAAYVTEGTLQRRYPASERTFTTSYSSIELGGEAFVSEPRPPHPGNRPFRLAMIGSLDQLYKGPDVLIEAVAINAGQGRDTTMVIIGDGQYRPQLEALARARGIEERVRFAGRLSAGAPVRRELDGADLFVLPSRTEGLPRALIEAMARGLPCVASDVGGIPELLPEEDRVTPGSAEDLALRIREILADGERQARMAARNLRKAHAYDAETLRGRRQAFYRAVRDASAR